MQVGTKEVFITFKVGMFFHVLMKLHSSIYSADFFLENFETRAVLKLVDTGWA